MTEQSDTTNPQSAIRNPKSTIAPKSWLNGIETG
jgi:hypothetical protein